MRNEKDLNIRVSLQFHTLVKTHAALRGLSIKALIISAVQEFIFNHPQV